MRTIQQIRDDLARRERDDAAVVDVDARLEQEALFAKWKKNRLYRTVDEHLARLDKLVEQSARRHHWLSYQVIVYDQPVALQMRKAAAVCEVLAQRLVALGYNVHYHTASDTYRVCDEAPEQTAPYYQLNITW